MTNSARHSSRQKLLNQMPRRPAFCFSMSPESATQLAGAHLYVTGIKDGEGAELMYFEIPLEKYLSAPSAPVAQELVRSL